MNRKIKDLSSKISKEIDIMLSHTINTKNLKTVCMVLGPYRNLTTLTSGILFLHPNCQVLNHAGERIFGDDRLDFLRNYNDKKFINFVKFAIHISKKGRRGDFGGSIIYSHAFDKKNTLGRMIKNNLKLKKPIIEVLLWKESLRVSNHIRQFDFDFDNVFQLNSKIKFLMPIRNPIDCAASNLNSGHINIFSSQNAKKNMMNALKAILEEIYWFKKLESIFTERFYYYFQYDLNENSLKKMLKFLGLNSSDDWISYALKAYQVKQKYCHSEEIINFYENYVETRFHYFPEFANKLLIFCH